MRFAFAFIAGVLLVAGCTPPPKDENPLLRKAGCLACHAVDRKVIGPGYADVAAKYRGDPDALARLAAKVKSGGAGVWGEIPMPPNPALADADVDAMVAYILALKK